MPDRAAKSTLLAAVFAAIAASTCCVGPLVFAAAGVGGAGALAALGAYRPYALGATGVLLACGFYFTYRKPKNTAADACGCARPRANLAGRIGLWVATVTVLVVAASPNVLAYLARPHGSSSSAATDSDTEKSVLNVKGVDCAACAAPIRRALSDVGGLRDVALDVDAQTVAITYEPATGRLQAYVAAINDLGYEASLATTARSRDTVHGEMR